MPFRSPCHEVCWIKLNGEQRNGANLGRFKRLSVWPRRTAKIPNMIDNLQRISAPNGSYLLATVSPIAPIPSALTKSLGTGPKGRNSISRRQAHKKAPRNGGFLLLTCRCLSACLPCTTATGIARQWLGQGAQEPPRETVRRSLRISRLVCAAAQEYPCGRGHI